jgi:hypothetical protein
MSEEKERFETWAIVELFGHSRIAGKVSEQRIAGAGFLRVDVPGTEGFQPFTRFYGAEAAYSITPTTEVIARRAAGLIGTAPIVVYGADVPELEPGEPVEVDPEQGVSIADEDIPF